MIKFDKWGAIANDVKSVMGYAVNGALHYANAILDNTEYSEVIAIGLNGYLDSIGEIIPEIEIYFISKNNDYIPKKISIYKDLSFLKKENIDKFIEELDLLNLTDEERESLVKKNTIDF